MAHIFLSGIALVALVLTGCKKDETPSDDVYGTMTDRDGNTYKTVTIGTQTWMSENLRVTQYRNGDPIPDVTGGAAWIALTTGASCTYANTTDNALIASYGRLYNWFAVSDSRNIAPAGWHVPTDAELTILATFLGGDLTAGGKMKETGTVHWVTPNTGATNESGFTALPSGARSDMDGTFNFLGQYGFYWSSTQYDAITAWHHGLDFNNTQFQHSYGWNKLSGAAVRLVKD